jgi:predicted Rossmann-fold nucleotide-binding protein
MATNTLSERIETLTSKAEAFIALPGGIGTLAEIAMVYNKIVISAVLSDTLILIGPGWQKTFEQFLDGQAENVNAKTRELPQFAADVDTSLMILNKIISGE